MAAWQGWQHMTTASSTRHDGKMKIKKKKQHHQ
jgi:hypothetical protein